METLYIGKTFVHRKHPCRITRLIKNQDFLKVFYKDLITGYENFKMIRKDTSQETNPAIIYDLFKSIDLPQTKVEILYETEDFLYALDLNTYEQIQIQKTESMDTEPQDYDDCMALVANYNNSWYICEIIAS